MGKFMKWKPLTAAQQRKLDDCFALWSPVGGQMALFSVDDEAGVGDEAEEGAADAVG